MSNQTRQCRAKYPRATKDVSSHASHGRANAPVGATKEERLNNLAHWFDLHENPVVLQVIKYALQRPSSEHKSEAVAIEIIHSLHRTIDSQEGVRKDLLAKHLFRCALKPTCPICICCYRSFEFKRDLSDHYE